VLGDGRRELDGVCPDPERPVTALTARDSERLCAREVDDLGTSCDLGGPERGRRTDPADEGVDVLLSDKLLCRPRRAVRREPGVTVDRIEFDPELPGRVDPLHGELCGLPMTPANAGEWAGDRAENPDSQRLRSGLGSGRRLGFGRRLGPGTGFGLGFGGYRR